MKVSSKKLLVLIFNVFFTLYVCFHTDVLIFFFWVLLHLTLKLVFAFIVKPRIQHLTGCTDVSRNLHRSQRQSTKTELAHLRRNWGIFQVAHVGR